MNLGQEIELVTEINVIGRPNYHNTYGLIAGPYLVVNAYVQNISNQQLTNTQQRLDTSKTKLESNDPNQLATLSRQELLGDIFHFDIPIVVATANTDGDQEKNKQYMIQTGILSSALEHATPEQMFATDDPNEPVSNAVSAVKALQIASQAGQRIYHITQENQATTLPNINHDSETIREIRGAINTGKEVTTHTDSISVPGWTGAGYIIIDPVTGEGAFNINGGSSWSVKGDGLGLAVSLTGPGLDIRNLFSKRGGSSATVIAETLKTTIKSLVSGVVNALSWVSRVAAPSGLAIQVAQYMAYYFILVQLLRFAQFNDILDECK